MRQTLTLPGQRELEQARAVIDSMDSSDSVSADGSLSWQRSTDNTLSLSPDLYSSRATNARREQRRWAMAPCSTRSRTSAPRSTCCSSRPAGNSSRPKTVASNCGSIPT
ncbi:hypothetical protein LP420_26025 [Massilia sp. B-10]|nr:hypothetical protein LP420_26025 [Massilia sp. B-10]